jgi:predicted Zn-dependent peptidase
MEFKKTKLKNGLTILFEKRDIPVTTVMLSTKFGSAYEYEEEKGIAHFIEHLCFKGTEKRNAKQIAMELEKVGGILNAFTSEEITAYHVKLPSSELNIAMDVIFDIFFNPIFPEKDVERERGVILEEIKMYKDDPKMHTIEKIKSLLYEKPFGIFTAGSEETLKKMSREVLLKKHHSIYIPENSILSVVGNNSFEEVVEMAEKFCAMTACKKNTKLKLVIPKIKLLNLHEKENREGLEQANLCLGFHMPFKNEKEKIVSEVFSAILGEGMSSKLFTEVREKRGLAYAVKAMLDSGKNYSYLIVYIGTLKEKVNEVVDLCLKEFQSMKNISEKELLEGKNQVCGNYDVESENSIETALNLILDEIDGDAEKYYKYKKSVSEVSLGDIKKIADISEKEFSWFVLS